ncbi:hypothetical protein QFC19_008709 [Naganishia cerealis]|uniref:Uncharacterized protein n=1 Tax=Naganishia cerealis TaxID=610337 RepID=A0ACC2V0F8_9TREE|nr:hypothetical protein QFC19_008709 [Naganishia cerealis]
MAHQPFDTRPAGDRVRSSSMRNTSRRDNDDDDYSRTRLVEGGERSRVDDMRRTRSGAQQTDSRHVKDGRSRDPGYARNERRKDGHHCRPGRESGSSLIAEIETLTAKLKRELQGNRCVPWDRSVEKAARQLRTAHTVLLFEHHTNPSAQNIDQLWMTTSYWVITAFRTMISEVEKKVASASAGGIVENQSRYVRRNGSNRGTSVEGEREREREKQSGPVELRKLLQRFQRFLTTEITFYQWLIRKLVKRFDLFGKHVNASELKNYLEMLNEGLESSDMERSEGEIGSPQGNDHVASDPSRPRDRLSTLDFTTLHLTREETHKKLQLVHKALLCLGDISRYKELYGPERERKRQERILAEGGTVTMRGKRNGKAGPVGARLKDNEERFRRAKQYYMVAKGFLPDNGNPFNQLAVISVEIGDTFDAIYHYHRALAVSQPFKSAGHNLRRSLDKASRDWTTYVTERKAEKGQGETIVFDDLVKGSEVDMFKNEEVIMQAIDGQAEVSGPELIDSHLDHLAMLIKDRILPSADIVKTVVLALAADWNTMMDQIPPSTLGNTRGDPQYYLVHCLAISQTVCQTALEEIQSCLAPDVLETLATVKFVPIPVSVSPLAGAEAEVDINLSVNITAALRRILPVLRIISKWLKGNIARLVRAEQDGGKAQEEVEIFASTYIDMLRHMEALFPLEQLPKLYDPLEEDYDMKGFSPVKRGMLESCSRSEAERLEAASPRHSSDVHPNETQLMRISDILLDGKLILFQTEAKVLFGFDQTTAKALIEECSLTSPELSASNAQLASLSLLHDVTVQPMPSTFAPPDTRRVEVDVEVASVGAETEDDPVTMAMRATMTDGSSLEDEEGDEKDFDDDEEEEQMVWGGRNTTPPIAVDMGVHGVRPNTSSTASDLLNTLIHGPAVAARNSQASSPTHRASFAEASRPLPNRLFGGNFGSIWAPAVGEVNLTGDMMRSRSGSGAGFPRVQRDMAHSPSIWGPPDVNRTPQQDALNSFASGSDSERHNGAVGDHANPPFTPFG